MKNQTTTKSAVQTGPLPVVPLGSFVYRDGAWYMTSPVKTGQQARG